MDEEGRPRSFQDSMSRFGADEARPDEARTACCTRGSSTPARGRRGSARCAAARAPGPARGHRRRSGASRASSPTTRAAAVEVQREAALAAGHEGVMVKAAESPYQAGRRGKAWRKVKPVHTLDLVVLAVEWGSGRRRGWLSNLHLGARDPDGGFVMVGKTFKGLTDALLDLADRAAAGPRDRPRRARRARPARAGRRDRARRRAALDPLPGRRRPPLRPGACATGRTRTPTEADLIGTVQAMLG